MGDGDELAALRSAAQRLQADLERERARADAAEAKLATVTEACPHTFSLYDADRKLLRCLACGKADKVRALARGGSGDG